MLRFKGGKDPDLRAAVERGEWAMDDDDLIDARKAGKTVYVPDMKPYRKKSFTYAAQIPEPFEVDTLEGTMQGKAGDWLACGVHGELYPIDAAVFGEDYEEAS